MDVRIGSRRDQGGGYDSLDLDTDRGLVRARYYPVPGARKATILVGGVGGDFDSPSRGLYPRLCRSLQDSGIAALRVQFRNATDLDEAVHDVLAGMHILVDEGFRIFALVGHSFGGPVVIRAAVEDERVLTVVTLATQRHGTDEVARLGPRCSILLIHGAQDDVVPLSSSIYVHDVAWQPKKMIIYDRARHDLDEVADDVFRETCRWLAEKLEFEIAGAPATPLAP